MFQEFSLINRDNIPPTVLLTATFFLLKLNTTQQPLTSPHQFP